MEPAVASVAPGAGIPASAGMIGEPMGPAAGTGPKPVGKPAGVAGPKPVAPGAGIPAYAGMVGKPMGPRAGVGPKRGKAKGGVPRPVGKPTGVAVACDGLCLFCLCVFGCCVRSCLHACFLLLLYVFGWASRIDRILCSMVSNTWNCTGSNPVSRGKNVIVGGVAACRSGSGAAPCAEAASAASCAEAVSASAAHCCS